MEKGYFHKDRGYWQTMGDVPLDRIQPLPEGTVEVPLKPGPDYIWNSENMEWVKLPLPAPTVQDVKEECLRRRKRLVGLSDDDPVSQLDYIRQNNLEEELGLLTIQREREWMTEETIRFQQLGELRARLKAVSVRSNEIQAYLILMEEQVHSLDIADDVLWDPSKTLASVLAEPT
ncbi:hypothetical protein [Pseudovibrio brasiliensis]|uniref:Uncharacterized protein n=1 Tax=Pseudovibrio brasiliensis TaxID=1898042 RepID=A0ABX8AZU5_9HYPH|nr:hypothetical protein [Pseudovibrio brasiliensis]QUS59211.1 hypothetical protein KGB56_26880 [Pseudovibrio brasiliensis]